jgi:hypothetical protein
MYRAEDEVIAVDSNPRGVQYHQPPWVIVVAHNGVELKIRIGAASTDGAITDAVAAVGDIAHPLLPLPFVVVTL